MRLIWPARSAHASITSRVRSVEPPSTQMCSMSKLRCCCQTDMSVSSIVALALSDTVMMEMNGFNWFLSWKTENLPEWAGQIRDAHQVEASIEQKFDHVRRQRLTYVELDERCFYIDITEPFKQAPATLKRRQLESLDIQLQQSRVSDHVLFDAGFQSCGFHNFPGRLLG